MNVRISYTIDIEEVPSKVRALLAETYDDLYKLYENKNFVLTKSNILDTLENIKQVRQKLLTVDTQLADCYNILAGYNKALAEAAMPQEEGSSTDAEPTDSQ